MPVNYARLKTNLQLAIQRLKLLEKKKTEAAQRSRKEIADYLDNGKVERAKIRVEHIIREDYLVEAMEIVEMFCDLLLTRFGMIKEMDTLDDGLEEAISSLIWVAPRMSTDIKELNIIAEIFTQKYGKQFAQASKENTLKTVNEKLMLKLGVQAPPKILVENYLIAIAKTLNVNYEPDEEVLQEDNKYSGDGGTGNGDSLNKRQSATNPSMLPNLLIDLDPNAPPVVPSNKQPALPSMPPSAPFSNQSDYLKKHLSGEKPPEIGFIDLPPQDSSMAEYSLPPTYDSALASNPQAPPPPSSAPSLKPSSDIDSDNLHSVPNLPDIPTDLDDLKATIGGNSTKPSGGGADANKDDVDFDDLRRRFEELKKRDN